ncbi:hypothetical protein [Nocardia mangyaensis]|uniref:hypothetical protein n=1 Tax=Nocardia mangyaensis TaxID=2213200 RepID=UPI0026761723|nr:hypothetical protein [Nocardia mangyaensis]MDO3645930.1 hypothetical protein [Nocardia mangyaensis]
MTSPRRPLTRLAAAAALATLALTALALPAAATAESPCGKPDPTIPCDTIIDYAPNLADPNYPYSPMNPNYPLNPAYPAPHTDLDL